VLTINILEFTIYAIIIGTEVITGIILAIRRITEKYQNLELLAGFTFSVAFVSFIYAMPDNLIRGLGFIVSLFLSSFFLLLFTDRMFFVGKKSPLITFLIIITIVSLGYVFIKLFLGVFQDDWQMIAFNNLLVSIIISIPGYWFGYLVLKQYNNIKNKNLEPWIKMRFLIAGVGALLEGSIGWISYMIVISQIPGVDPSGNFELLALFIYALILIIFSIGFFIAFVMPERLKKYFNRNYKTFDDKGLSEDEIMKKMGGGE